MIIVLLAVFSVYLYPQFAPPPKPEFKDVIISLERNACYGVCPVYKLTIFGNGKVVYKGIRFVNATGTKTYQISRDKIKELVGKFYEIDYFALKDKYDGPVTDAPATITSITIDGKTKRVVNYYGAPKKLIELEDKIDEMADSEKWIKR